MKALLIILNLFIASVASAHTYTDSIIAKAVEIHSKWKSSKSTVIMIDFSKPMEQNRLFVVDVNTRKIVISSTVCHGKGSGKTSIPTKFSNVEGSLASSLGVMKTGNSFYSSFGYSMLVYGLEPCNSNVRVREIIFHTSAVQHTPWSWGCFATPDANNKKIIDLTKDGSLIYVFR